jgi:hypothetical protein
MPAVEQEPGQQWPAIHALCVRGTIQPAAPSGELSPVGCGGFNDLRVGGNRGRMEVVAHRSDRFVCGGRGIKQMCHLMCPVLTGVLLAFANHSSPGPGLRSTTTQ